MTQPRRRAAQRLRRTSLGLALLVFVAHYCGLVSAQTGDITRAFQNARLSDHEYADVRSVQLGALTFVLGFWHPDNSPLELSTDIYRYVPHSGQPPFTKEFSGNVSEEILGIAPLDFAGEGHLQLAILSRSGQIKILRVLDEKKGSFRVVFENGGTDVTVVEDAKEIWLKSNSARQVDVYRWSERPETYTEIKTLNILF